MILKLVFAVNIVWFTICVELILASRNFDLNMYPDLEELPSGDNDTNLDRHYSSSDTGWNKRSRKSSSSQTKEAKTSSNSTYKRLKYSSKSQPLTPVISEILANNLKFWEEIILSKGKNCVWHNFNNLSIKQAKHLCIQAWNIEVQEISGIEVKDEMTLDCDTKLIYGPSDPNQNPQYYNGIYQYTQSIIGFSPDLVRCNCAVVNVIRGKFIAEEGSKRFFFLYKQSDTVYYVLTIINRSSTRLLKIVNVRTLL